MLPGEIPRSRRLWNPRSRKERDLGDPASSHSFLSFAHGAVGLLPTLRKMREGWGTRLCRCAITSARGDERNGSYYIRSRGATKKLLLHEFASGDERNRPIT